MLILIIQKNKLLKDEEMLISTQFIADQNNLGSVNILMLIECNIKKGVEVFSMSGYVSDDKE